MSDAATPNHVTLNHVTLCCAPSQLASVQRFYEQVLGLSVGDRPAFAFAGRWLYAQGQPIVHLAATLPEADSPDAGDSSHPRVASPDTLPDTSPASPDADADALASTTAAIPTAAGALATTGAIDHLAFRVTLSVQAMRDRLQALALPFSEAPVPGFALHQLFVADPLGIKVELNFELSSRNRE